MFLQKPALIPSLIFLISCFTTIAKEDLGLSAELPPGHNFELTDWNISLPVDTNKDGRVDTIPAVYLEKGFEYKPYFYTAADGGMVFTAFVDGVKTSKNTKYTRTELREMLRRGDNSVKVKGVTKNNWVFSSVRSKTQRQAGGVDGTLKATVAVNNVTVTGEAKQVGRVIIGQIHAKDDEPARLYYRKLPKNSKGVFYLAHEPRKGNEQYYEFNGSRASNAEDPADGIALDEKFSYTIDVKENILTVSLIREGKEDITQVIDMKNSGYHKRDQYMYFKAGVYNQNNSGDPKDYVQATFYRLENSHVRYDY